eukprot:144317-Prorocentrum_minimum.AAC.1
MLKWVNRIEWVSFGHRRRHRRPRRPLRHRPACDDKLAPGGDHAPPLEPPPLGGGVPRGGVCGAGGVETPRGAG